MAHNPVCKMPVKEISAEVTTEHKGKTYYFCAAGCKETFEKEQEKHVEGSTENKYSHG